MKYLSPSPVLDASVLPTPPHSPDARQLVPHHKAAVAANMLDSLCSFYQQERYWVHHTRASLELALSKGIDARALMYPDGPTDAASPASSTSTLCDSPPQHTVSVKPDPDVESTAAAAALHDDISARTSRWLRRKNKMRLHLQGISSQPHRGKKHAHAHAQPRPLRAPPTEPGARLLEMFSELVDARMESCQRISRMVQESAGRQQLCFC